MRIGSAIALGLLAAAADRDRCPHCAAATCSDQVVQARGEPSRFEVLAKAKARGNWRAQVRAMPALGPLYANWSIAAAADYDCTEGKGGIHAAPPSPAPAANSGVARSPAWLSIRFARSIKFARKFVEQFVTQYRVNQCNVSTNPSMIRLPVLGGALEAMRAAVLLVRQAGTRTAGQRRCTLNRKSSCCANFASRSQRTRAASLSKSAGPVRRRDPQQGPLSRRVALDGRQLFVHARRLRQLDPFRADAAGRGPLHAGPRLPAVGLPTAAPAPQNRPSIWPFSLRRMLLADGTLGRPGMVMISPVIDDDELGAGRRAAARGSARRARSARRAGWGRSRTNTASWPCTPAGGRSRQPAAP